MKQQVGVTNLIHTAMPEEATHMFLQLLAAFERVEHAVHQVFLLDRQRVRVFRVDGRPVFVFQFIFFPVQMDGPAFQVDMV